MNNKNTYRFRPGGRMMVADIVLLSELPRFIQDSVEAYAGCLSGAILKDQYLEAIRAVGFLDVQVVNETPVSMDLFGNDALSEQAVENSQAVPGSPRAIDFIRSIQVSAVKPLPSTRI
jgi:arsenite methyltransferase